MASSLHMRSSSALGFPISKIGIFRELGESLVRRWDQCDNHFQASHLSEHVFVILNEVWCSGIHCPDTLNQIKINKSPNSGGDVVSATMEENRMDCIVVMYFQGRSR